MIQNATPAGRLARPANERLSQITPNSPRNLRMAKFHDA